MQADYDANMEKYNEILLELGVEHIEEAEETVEESKEPEDATQ